MISNVSLSPGVSIGERASSSVKSVNDFSKIAERANIRFTSHAQSRLNAENTPLTTSDLDRLDKGIQKAANKGGHESLLLMEDKAFIVNPRERVVITSINRERLKENVFTNIDSAVII